MPLPSVNENISTTLSSGITDVATSMDVGDATKIPSVCYLVIDRVDSAGTLKATSLWEYVKVTNVAGQTCTITRGQGGSTGQAHSSGAVVEAVVTSSMFEDWYAALNPEHTAIGGHVIGTATIAVANIGTYLSVSGASITGIFPSSVSFPTDGWTDDTTHTWTYASASTFTIAGVDLTTTFTKGTRLRFKQGAGYKYAVVVLSSFSTNTTVTILINTDYTIANSAITDNYYSYQVNPQGYPGWFVCTDFSFDTSVGADNGSGSQPASVVFRRNIVGNICYEKYVTGTAYKTTTNNEIRGSVTSINPANTADLSCIGSGYVQNNGGTYSIGTCFYLATGYRYLIFGANITDNVQFTSISVNMSFEF